MKFFKRNTLLIFTNIIAFIILIGLTIVIHKKYNNKSFVSKQVITLENDFHIPEDKDKNSAILSKPLDQKNPSALIMLMIGPIGINPKVMQEVLNLPKEVIIGVSPYSANLDDVINQVVGYNHEILLNIPMQPSNYPIEDPGPYALFNNKTEEENKTSLISLIDQCKSINGIYSDVDEVYTNNVENIAMIINVLKEKKLNFFYGYGQENILATQTAKKLDYNIIVSDILIDQEINYDKINSNLAKLEKLATNDKITVATARPYPPSINAINLWIKSLDKKNIKLIKIDQLKNLSLKK